MIPGLRREEFKAILSKEKVSMRRLLIMICGFAAALSAQSTGTVSGILKSNGGAPISGAIVTAYLQTKTSDGKFPPVFNALTGADGSFVLNGLVAGTYVLCAEKVDAALLNPCFWSTKSTTLTVAPSGGSVTGVSMVAELGVPLTIRLNDQKGLLASNSKLDDVVIGVKPTTGPPLPAMPVSKDSTGRTLKVLVPLAKPAGILVYSRNLSLSDDLGNSYSKPNMAVTVTAPVVAPSSGAGVGSPAGSPALTLSIQGQAPKP
jgi:hypothetical protein